MSTTRRTFLKQTAILGAAAVCSPLFAGQSVSGSKMKLGLCTYQWGKDWDVPTLLANCEKARIYGLELRTEHKHGVEPRLSTAERAEVRKRFADSPVVFVGYGANAEYHSSDPATVRKNIELSKELVKLVADCGGSGVKVKPNNLPKDIPQEKTIAQIAASLNEIGKFAADFNQEIRLEVHGQCSKLPIMKSIIDQVSEKNVGICWNCNGEDLQGESYSQ